VGRAGSADPVTRVLARLIPLLEGCAGPKLSAPVRTIARVDGTEEVDTAGPALEVLRRVFGYDAFRGPGQFAQRMPV
jgi:hypothetical protein